MVVWSPRTRGSPRIVLYTIYIYIYHYTLISGRMLHLAQNVIRWAKERGKENNEANCPSTHSSHLREAGSTIQYYTDQDVN